MLQSFLLNTPTQVCFTICREGLRKFFLIITEYKTSKEELSAHITEHNIDKQLAMIKGDEIGPETIYKRWPRF